MKRTDITLLAAYASLAGVEIAVSVWSGLQQDWWGTGFSAAATVVPASFFVSTLRRIRHGSRQAREDHRSGSALDAVASASPAASASERTSPGIVTETSAEPIRAWKVARLVVSPSGRGVRLASLNELVTHPVEGTAHCTAMRFSTFRDLHSHHYDAPHLDCTCGFYAWKTREQAAQMVSEGGLALLDIELFGKVIQHEHGYRAEKQRVLGVQIDPTCNHFMCVAPAVVIDFPRNLNPSSMQHDAVEFKVWCETHRHEAGDRTCSLQDVANSLRCEVAWSKP